MRRYETFVILDPDLTEDKRGSLCERLQDKIDEKRGLLVERDEWGFRKLAYEVKKKDRGHYVRFDYCGSSELVNELERIIRINDGFLKYMTVLLDRDIDIETIKAEIDEKQQLSVSNGEGDLEPAPDPESKAVTEAAETPEPGPEAEAPVPEAQTENTSETEAAEIDGPAPQKSEEE